MGVYDREYYRKPTRGEFAHLRPMSVTTWLIVINVAAFLLDPLLARVLAGAGERGPAEDLGPLLWLTGPLYEWGHFSVQQALVRLQLWRFITFQFLHADVLHILFNMAGLFMFGAIVEGYLGARKYVAFYLLCGAAGPVCFSLLWGAGLMSPPGAAGLARYAAATPMVGASAGVFAVLMAAGWVRADERVWVYFGYVPIRVLAWVLVGLALYRVITLGPNAGGEAAHLGGALLGWLLIQHDQWLNIVERRRKVRGRRVKDWSRDFNR